MNATHKTAPADRDTSSSTAPQPLRLWPGVVLVALQWLLRYGLPVVAPDALYFAVMASVTCGFGVGLWWLFFSRAAWVDRIGAIALSVLALFVASRLVHPSIAGGMMGMMLPLFAIPVLSLALVVAAAATRRSSAGSRRVGISAAIVLACGAFTLLRTGGITSEADADFHWRWTQTPEERLLAEARERNAVSKRTAPAVAAPAAYAEKPPQWPGFRGPQRDSVLRGVRIATDWATSPPAELWRRPVGPGWSSFAVGDGVCYTQEQRGEEEVVACYNLANGEPIWHHQDTARFWESNAGPGPRGTPTLHEGRVYTFGATGVLNALNARDGAVVWTRNAATDTDRKVPDWGFASSPLVFGDRVVVAVSGTLAAYDRQTGEPRWVGPADGKSYSSPHMLEIDGVQQIVLMSGAGATSVSPSDGKVLWQHAWPGFAIVQPAQIANGNLLISTGDRIGARRIEVARTKEGWTVSERWTSTRLKAYFNDYVVHRGHAYGFDGGILACVNLEDGGRKWKGGRYGSGQVLLFADQDVLLVQSEQGELALVRATPDEFAELARFPAVKGKTWNHPVLAGDVLLVRNDHEMVALRLTMMRQ